jgi:hypothetical protein
MPEPFSQLVFLILILLHPSPFWLNDKGADRTSMIPTIVLTQQSSHRQRQRDMTKQTTCTKRTRTTPPQSKNPELFSVVTFYMLFFLTLILPNPRPALSTVRPWQSIERSKR